MTRTTNLATLEEEVQIDAPLVPWSWRKDRIMVHAPLKTSSISVLLADDHHLLRQSLKMLLANSPDIQVVGEARTGRETIAQAMALHPNVVVLDITMPDMNGIAACHEICTGAPHTHVLMLTMHESEGYFFQALQAGASGYLLKKAAPGELRQAIRAVSRGNAFVSPDMLQVLLDSSLLGTQASLGKASTADEKLSLLTPRQLSILRLLAQGETNQRIADQLGISIKTVQAHRASIMERLGLGNVAQLVCFAIRAGFLSLNDGLL